MPKIGASHKGGFQLPMFLPASDWQRPAALPDLRGKVTEIGIDSECRDEGLRLNKGAGWALANLGGNVCGISVAYDAGDGLKSFYAPIAHPDTDCFDKAIVADWLKKHAAAGIHFIFQNAPYDIGWFLRDFDLDPAGVKIEDTLAAAVMVDENRFEYGLDSLCRWQGIDGKDEAALREAAAAFDVDPKSGLWRLPARYVGPYAGQDAAATYLLMQKLRPIMAEEKTTAAYQLEMDLVPLTVEMRWRGIAVDLVKAEEGARQLRKARDACLAQLSRNAGETIEIGHCRSNDSLVRLFEKEGVLHLVPGQTAGNKPSFTKDWMAGHEHWLPSLVSKATQYDSGASKFLEGFILDFAIAGRLHATINQYRGDDGKGTRTTRFSYSDPPLQQMPARDEEIATIVRRCFLPEIGGKYLGADYSQQELRLIVGYAEKARLPRAADAAERYRTDPTTDFHKLVIEWTGLKRKSAKNATFAKSYGAGIPKFAAMIGGSQQEAKRVMGDYDRELPFVQKLADKCSEVAAARGFIVLLDGARSHFDRWEPAWREDGEDWFVPVSREQAEYKWPGRKLKRGDTRKAMNRLIQGGAARQTKLAMRACWREGIVPLLQMHDELGFSIADPSDGRKAVALMRDAASVGVPMKVDEDYGETWGDATRDLPDDEAWKKQWKHVKARAA